MPGHILLSFLHDWECVLRCLQVRISHTHAHRHTLDHFDGLIPFDFKTEPAESNSKYLVNLLSLELTYFCSGLLFAAVVRRRVWDYALTITILHVMITSLGEWKSCSGLFLMICNGQLIAYFTCQSDQSYASFSFY
uniref:Transmembrane protein 244-like n=1 Tax=Sander lucioperca TaxID=283035 RepID=A0A8C9WZZ9_SANLU